MISYVAFQGAEESGLPSASDPGVEPSDRAVQPESWSPIAAAPTAAGDNATPASLRMVSSLEHSHCTFYFC